MSYNTDITNPRNDPSNLELRQLYSAEVVTTATALTNDVYVILPQFEDEGGLPHRHGPCLGWDRRSDGAYPTSGDTALVAVDDDGNYWILNWWPY